MGVFVAEAQQSRYEQFIVIKNEAAINSEYLEYSPAFYEDGLVYISTKVAAPKKDIIDKNIDKHLMSIYRAKRNGDGFLTETEVFAPELLSKFHEGPLTFSRDNSTVYFSRNNEQKEKIKKRKMNIYSATKSGEGWSDIKELPFNNDEYETMHPSISADDDALYFASDRLGGFGGMDIWVAYKNGDEWSDPINLGASVNSDGDESFPFISPDGTLFYSSNGFGGNGELDIFYVQKEGYEWGAPTNLEAPFNTPQDDFGFIMDRDNKNGYFSSNRADGRGNDDIYHFHVMGEGGLLDVKELIEEEEKREIPFAIKDKDGNPIDGVRFSYIDLDDRTLGEAIKGTDGNSGILKLKPSADGQSYTIDFDQSTPLEQDANGEVILPEGNFIMKVEKEGYETQYVTVTPEIMEAGLFVDLVPEGLCAPFEGLVYSKNEESLPLAGATLLLTDTESGEEITVLTDNVGKANTCLPCGRTFTAIASQNAAVSGVKMISTAPCNTQEGLSDVFFLESAGGAVLVAGTVIQLPNIYYNFNDATLRPDAKQDLDAVITFMNAYPNIQLELGSHTDSRGAKSYNKSLSQNRSDNALSYLLEKGADPNRITAVGYGESKIRNRCIDGVRCRENGHQENRRTEIKIMSVGSFGATKYVQYQKEEATTRQAETIVESPVQESVSQPESISVSSSGGNYYVVAGSFKVPENAYRHVEKLRGLGYNDTTIINFENMKNMKSVCVASYQNEGEANTLAKKLKKKYKIKTYVKEL